MKCVTVDQIKNINIVVDPYNKKFIKKMSDIKIIP